MLSKDDVTFETVKRVGRRLSDGMGIWDVGSAMGAAGKSRVIVLSKSTPNLKGDLTLIPLISFLNHSDPDDLQLD